jgi:branched-chain amino acid transport system substrate-binding protein
VINADSHVSLGVRTDACRLAANKEEPVSIRLSSSIFSRPVLALGLLGLGIAAAQGADPVKVGYVIPLSGSASASIGQEMSKATHLAVKHINEGGGIAALGGAKIELIEADTRGDPQVGLTETERLIAVENVPVIIGAFQSAVTFPATAVAEKYQVPWIVDLSAKADITERGFRYVFRPTQIPSSGNADSVVDFVVWAGEQSGEAPKTAAIVYENTDWGQDLAGRMRTRFADAGIEVVLDESYPANSPDLRPLVLKLKGRQPDIVSITAYSADAILLHKLIAQMQVNAMAVIGSGAGQVDPTFIPSVGADVAENVFTTNGWAGRESTINTPFAQRFWDEYVAAYGVEPSEFSVVGYSVVWILKYALERAGKAEPEAIRDALAETRFEGNDVARLLGYDVVFDEKGQNTLKRFVMQQISNGAYRTVWPPAVAAPGYDMVWPVQAN